MANENLTFRCADAGHAECPWEASANNEQELLDRVRQHGREKHGITDWTDEISDKVRTLFHRRAA